MRGVIILKGASLACSIPMRFFQHVFGLYLSINYQLPIRISKIVRSFLAATGLNGSIQNKGLHIYGIIFFIFGDFKK